MSIRTPAFVIPLGVLVALALPVGGTAASISAEAHEAHSAAQPDQAHAFDFLNGRWKVHNRRLVKRLAGLHEWVEFEATDVFRPFPGLIGNEEHYRTDYWKNFVGIGIRLYNPVTKQWNLYWTDNHSSAGYFQVPVTGAFSGNVGVFKGQDTFEGRPIVVRFIWKRIGEDRAHWEQAFSADGGKTWETNWTMDFTRAG